MPKKNSAWGENSKAVEARERKSNARKAEQDKKQKTVEDAYWKDDDKNIDRKKERKDNAEQKKQEALKRKQDARKLLEEEEAKTTESSKKTSAAPKKVTMSDIDKIKEKERKQQELLAKEKEKERKNLTDNPEMEEENPNIKMAQILAEEGAIEARSLTDAIEVLDIGAAGVSGTDRHPEKRMKAAYNEFEERELPKLKAENPNLRLSQLKQILRKEWQKSPENPLNMR